MEVGIQRSLLNEQVYNYIKEKIINDELKPNEKIDVTLLAKKLNVSRTPVTAALSRLQHDGYVTILPQSGTFVRNHSYNELYIIYKSRAYLEKAIVETYGSQYRKAALLDIRRQFEELGGRDENPDDVQNQLFAVDLKFHEMLLESCEEIIRSNVISIADLTKRSRLLYFKLARDPATNLARIRRNIKIHCDIIDALLTGDYDKAGQLVYNDIITTFDCIKSFI